MKPQMICSSFFIVGLYTLQNSTIFLPYTLSRIIKKQHSQNHPTPPCRLYPSILLQRELLACQMYGFDGAVMNGCVRVLLLLLLVVKG
mmetsp:Transcript_19172/g.22085  ORF Transcript_19172/g.22085 Transcript_19172/m.22085 type:complete len:88 (+) Transcript_19172:423-686(+)